MFASPVAFLVALLALHHCGTEGGPMGMLAEREATQSNPTMSQNSQQGSTSAEPEIQISFEDLPQNAGVNITVTAPSPVLDKFPFIDLKSRGEVDRYCIALSPASTVGRSVVEEHLPLDDYCARLQSCPCGHRGLCYKRPLFCQDYPYRAGVDMDAWANQTTAHEEREKDTDAGPAVSVAFLQFGPRFPNLRIIYDGCANGSRVEMEVPADQRAYLHHGCALRYDTAIKLLVRPLTRVCEKTGNCLHKVIVLPPMSRQPPPPPPPQTTRSASPSGLLSAGIPLLVVSLIAVCAAGLIWYRRSHRQMLDSVPPIAGRENIGFDHEQLVAAADCAVSAGRPAGLSVLLLHLARSDAERAAVRQLTADLRARGAAVTDSDAPEWRRAARRDATALASAVSVHDRVLLLSSPAAVAAVAAGGPRGESERLLAAAVRQVLGSRRTADYGRLYQARLAADGPTVTGLVPGAVYTLPEHRQELVTALLITVGASMDRLTDKGTGVVSGSNNSDTSSGSTGTNSDSVHTAETVTLSEPRSPDQVEVMDRPSEM